MSGTSLDGVDAALLHTDGENIVEREGFVTIPYSDELRAKIRAVLGKTREEALDVERELTQIHATAVKEVGKGNTDLIGFHGQTIAHDPEKGTTCQIGDGALLAKLTGIKVVNDFRTADVKAGGQGAPLVPVYHQALAAGMEKPVAFLNIGGVANVTYVGDELLAFDTGPGNALIDDWMLQKTKARFDEDGKLARTGKVDENILRELLSNPFFKKPAPKSLDRNAFVSSLWENLSVADGAATLTAFTAGSIAVSMARLPSVPKRWILCGGGRKNIALVEMLQGVLQGSVEDIDTLGLNGDAIEAEAFAYLAVRSVKGLPISFPGTTGVAQPMTGGKICA